MVIQVILHKSSKPGGIAMPATVTTREDFEKSISRADLEEEVRLRIKAGAIRSSIEDTGDRWTIVTEWNVLGG
jgi:hypothetical protein